MFLIRIFFFIADFSVFVSLMFISYLKIGVGPKLYKDLNLS